jgi:hypothetical protein
MVSAGNLFSWPTDWVAAANTTTPAIRAAFDPFQKFAID